MPVRTARTGINSGQQVPPDLNSTYSNLFKQFKKESVGDKVKATVKLFE